MAIPRSCVTFLEGRWFWVANLHPRIYFILCFATAQNRQGARELIISIISDGICLSIIVTFN